MNGATLTVVGVLGSALFVFLGVVLTTRATRAATKATEAANKRANTTENNKVDLTVFQESVAELRRRVSDLEDDLKDERAARQKADERAESAEMRAAAAQQRADALEGRVDLLEQALRAANVPVPPD